MVKYLFAAACALALSCLFTRVASAAVPKFCSGCDFAGAKLSGSDFTRGTYIGVNFEGADLSGSSLRQGRFLAANFQSANLNGAHFDGAQCMACNFSGAKLEGATFAGVLMVAANFKGFRGLISDEQLRQLLSGCVSCNFSGANMAGRDLSGIPLISVDFSQADLRGTKFDGSILCWNVTRNTQRQATCDSMRGAQTHGASFTGVEVCDDPLDRQTCKGVDAQTLRNDTGSPLDGTMLPQ